MANSCIGAAIREYGLENFKAEIIEECGTAKKLEEREKYWIKKFKSKFPNGYNLNFGRNDFPRIEKLPDFNEMMNAKKIDYVDVVRKTLPGKWMIPILNELSSGAKRFNQLQKAFGITQTVLSRQLKILEREGLVHREVFPTVPPQVEYSLTEIGQSFQIVLDSIEVWGKNYIEFLKNRDAKKISPKV